MSASRPDTWRARVTQAAAAFVSALVVVFVVAAPVSAEPLNVDGIEDRHELSSHLSILKDASKSLGIDDVLSPELARDFQPTDGRAPSFGYVDAAFWIKFTLENATSAPVSKVLELAYPTVNELDLFVQGPDGTLRRVESGMRKPFSARDYIYQNFLFDVTVPARSEVTVYLRFFSLSSSLIPLTLWDRYTLFEYVVRNQYVLGAVAGAFLVLILYNAFLYLSLRDRSYLYYIFFLICGLFYQMSVKGIAYELLWPGNYYWGDRSLAFFVFATLTSVSLFTMELLALKKLLPGAFRAYQVIAVAMGVTAVSSLIFDYATFVFLATALGGSVTLFLFCSAGYFYYRRVPYSGQYLAGWLLLTVGMLLATLKFIGVLPSMLLTDYGFELGSVFQVSFFSIALADRINHLKREVIVEEQRRTLSEEKSQELEKKNEIIRRAMEELHSLAAVSQIVNSTLDLQEVLSSIVRNAVELSGTEGGVVAEADEETGGFYIQATYGLPNELVDTMRRVPLQPGEGITDQTAAEQASIQIPDLRAVPQNSRWLQLADKAGFRSLLVVPLARDGRVLGILAVSRKAPGKLSPEVIELLQTFATQSTLAIQNARLFREIAQQSHELEVASDHKSQFLANMSHELRTPLNAILGYTELIADGIYGDVPKEILEVLERVQGSGRNLLRLINDVLDLSKIEAGQLDLAIDDYSFPEIVQGVAIALEPLASEKGLVLSTDIASELPMGYGDERRLSQIITNLVGNAIKFTDEGEIKIRVAATEAEFFVSVSDTGPGIPQDQQGQLFEEFQQVDSSSTRRQTGTGLGLAISKRIVELHGGSIWVESVPGRGSTFAFRMPAAISLGET